MISYAQNFEDVLLSRCFHDVTEGFYVDIGAYHPVTASVTKIFYDAGWSGINVEPGQGISALRAERPRDINLALAVTDREGETDFWQHTKDPGTSTLLADVAEVIADRAGKRIRRRVATVSLAQLLAQHGAGRHIHFLKVDAEGSEDAIIAGGDWRRFRPEVLVVESTEPYSNRRRKAVWQEILQHSEYLFAYFDGINDFWVREESRSLLDAFGRPVNVLDDFRIYDPNSRHLEKALAHTRDSLASAQATLVQVKEEFARTDEEKKNIEAALDQARDQLVTAEKGRTELQVALNEAQHKLISSRQEIDLLQASLAHAERELAQTRQELSTLGQALSDMQRWRGRLVDKLKLKDGPREIRLVLPLARIVRTVLPRGNSEVGAIDVAAHPGRKKRGPRRKLKKALKRVRRLGRRTIVAAARRTIAPAAAGFAQRFPKVFAKLRKDIRNRIGGEAAQAVLPPAPTIPPQVLEDALLTIALSQNTTSADAAALLSRRDTE